MRYVDQLELIGEEAKQVNVVYGKRTLSFFIDDQFIYESMKKTTRPYEYPMLKWIEQNINGGSFIDVGSNFGNHAVFFASFCTEDTVFAYEPIPRNFQLLVANTVNNGLLNIVPIQRGVGKEPGVMGYSKSPEERWSQCRLVNYSSEDADSGRIMVSTLDEDLSHVQDIRLIKIDCEGMEYEVLKGCRKILHEQHPEIFVEIFDEDERQIIEQTILFPAGYTLIERYNEAPTYHYSASGRFPVTYTPPVK